MTGLEKIVEQIMQEAQTTSEEKLSETKKEVEKILSEAKRKRESCYALEIEKADADAKQLLLRGQSAAALQERKLLLEAKQQMIQQIFEEAVNVMQKLPQEEYFHLLLHMVDRYALPESGTIHLSKEDLERMPERFLQELRNRKIAISEEPARIHGGFILSYGEILENCSFEALISENRETLQDQIASLIF